MKADFLLTQFYWNAWHVEDANAVSLENKLFLQFLLMLWFQKGVGGKCKEVSSINIYLPEIHTFQKALLMENH